MNTPGYKRGRDCISPESVSGSPEAKTLHSDEAASDNGGNGQAVTVSHSSTPEWFQQFNSTLDNRIGALIKAEIERQLIYRISEMEDKIDSAERKVREMELQMGESAAKMDSLVDDLTQSNSDLVSENEKLKEKVQSLESQITVQEDYSRKMNLRLDGVKEEPGEDTEEVVRGILRSKLKIADRMDIDVCHRVGKRQDVGQSQGSSKKNRQRTVLVRFTKLSDRNRVWARKRELKGSNIFINEDFSIQTEKRRRQLYPSLKAAIKDGCKSYLKGDKLVISGQTFCADTVPQKYKF